INAGGTGVLASGVQFFQSFGPDFVINSFSAGDVLTLGPSGVGLNHNATINAQIAGTNGLSVGHIGFSSGGILTQGAAGLYTGPTTINGAGFVVTLQAGTASVFVASSAYSTDS